MNKSIQPILDAFNEGHSAVGVYGRSLYDFVSDDGRIRPLLEVLRQELCRSYGMVFMTFSLANGLQWFEGSMSDEADRRTVRTVLEKNQLLKLPPDENIVVSAVRGVTSIFRSSGENLKWQDSKPMRFAVCFEFIEHLAPGGLANGTQTDSQIIVSELVHIASQSIALRDSGNLVLFHGRDDLIDELVCGALTRVHLRQPGAEEKQEFIQAALDLYNEASFEEGLSSRDIVTLTVNTTNRGLEGLLRASHRARRNLTAKEISEQKDRDVEQLSEGTLMPLDTNRVRSLQLVGRNIEVPKTLLLKISKGLLAGDSSNPANVLLDGAPGTGKTDLALMAANEGKAPAYEMRSPKGSLVGETERKVSRQQDALKEWVPNVAFCDEITEALPLERSDFDGDSGASRAVSAALHTALSDESRRGRSLLIATTNRPWAMSAAMRSRFTIIPVLFPLREDFAGIIVTTAKRIAPNSEIVDSDPAIRKAADLFYSKGANPRHIRAALSNTLLLRQTHIFSAEDILFAAADLCATTDFVSSIFADLWAIKCCSSRSFLPWSDSPGDYDYPDYIAEVVDHESGDVIEEALNKKLEALKPHAKV